MTRCPTVTLTWRPWSGRRKGFGITVVVALACIVLAACGSSSKSSSTATTAKAERKCPSTRLRGDAFLRS